MSSSDTTDVSVIIVNYRSYPELQNCLQSLESLDRRCVEVIVVDHATSQVDASAITRRFPWIRFVPVADNPGFAAGVNRGARAATGRHLLLLNPDCLASGDFIEELSRWLDSHPAVAVLGGLVRNADGTIQDSARRFPTATTALGGRTTWLTRFWPANPWTRRNLVGRGVAAPTEVDWVSGACTMIRREAFDAVGGMDEGFFLYWEDADLCLRLKQRGWSTVYHPGAGVTHLTGRSSAHARRQSLVAFHRSAFRYFTKHARPAARLIAPLVYLALQMRLYLKLAGLQLTRR